MMFSLENKLRNADQAWIKLEERKEVFLLQKYGYNLHIQIS